MNNSQKVFRFREGSLPLGSRTYIMGIINITPDSFSDGGENLIPENALKTALDMQKAGADILDIGGQSTRPGHTPVAPDDEWQRLKAPLELIIKNVNIPVSVDTFYPEVAKKALEMGAHIINDVSGKVNPEMTAIVKKYGAGIVLMHSGEEKTNNIISTVNAKLTSMLAEAVQLGVPPENICLDPGIGFGKTNEQSLELINNTADVKVGGTAYLLAASRKRVIAYLLGDEGIPPNKRDEGTVAAHLIGVKGGADIIRVHNVPLAVKSLKTLSNERNK